MLLSFHVMAISILSAVVGAIAYRMGKKEGIRLSELYHEEAQEQRNEKLSAA